MKNRPPFSLCYTPCHSKHLRRRAAMETESGARSLHRKSKHSRLGLIGGRGFEWKREPGRVKEYPGAKTLPLPAPALPATTLGAAISGEGAGRRERFGFPEAATLLQMSYGVIRRSRLPFEDFAFRAAPSAGALYPAELYLCCGKTDGLEAGIFHYNPLANHLALVRIGDWRGAVSEALGGNAPAAAYALITALPGRSEGRYAQRAYRYSLLDSGHLAGNLLLIGKALGLAPRLVTLAREKALNALLGLEDDREVFMAAVPLLPDQTDLPSPPAGRELKLHYNDPEDDARAEHATQFRRALESRGGGDPGAKDALPLAAGLPGGASLAELIASRASYRKRARRGVTFQEISEYLNAVSWAYKTDWRPEHWKTNRLPALRLAVFDVENLAEGLYDFDAERGALIRSSAQLSRSLVAAACMGQTFVAQANAFLAIAVDFDLVDSEYAYKAAGLDAGIVGQSAYLAAEALGAGCCGIGAFFDDDLSEAFGFDAGKKQVIYALTLAER
jgi:SagB-type dehydrogenase family enzyme